MKVLLVTPPYHCGVVESAGRWMPLSLFSLAGALRDAGHDVEVYDAMSLFHTQDDVRRTLAARRPDVVGVTTITATAPASLAVLRSAKVCDPGVRTVMGGVHGTFLWKEVLGAPDSPVDFVVRGEGEETLPELLACLAAGDDPATVPGIACRRDGVPVSAPPRPRLADLEAHPPAWDLVPWSDYTYFPFPGSRLAIVSTSRGCVFGCSFCSQQKFWSRSWRPREPERVVAELEHLRDAYGVDVALLADEYPTPDAKRWKRFLDLLIERKVGTRLLMETRVEDVVRDGALMETYRRAGIIHVYVGVEATNQASLDRFNKQLRVEQSREALRLIHGAGMVSETSFVLGMPEETPATIRATLELAKDYDPDFAHFLLIAPWPYADLARELEPYLESRDYADYNLVTPVARSAAMTRAELMASSVDCYHKFYMAKLPKWFAMPDGFKKDYLLTSMKLILKSSFLRQHMGGLGAIPAEVQRYLGALRGART